MDWTTVLTGLISALISGGGLLGVFYMKETKKAKQLANESTAVRVLERAISGT